MKKYLLLIFILSIGVWVFFLSSKKQITPISTLDSGQARMTDESESQEVEVVAKNLDTPWSLVFLPDNTLLISERKGTIRIISPDQKESTITIEDVKEIGEGGLLGLEKDPSFDTNHFIYVYYTYSNNKEDTLNRVVRYQLKNNQLTDRKILIDSIPGASNHNGGRIKFGPDGLLYITTGDAQNPSQAQNTNSLAGKILRIDKNGGTPTIFSYGHRNPQGLTWDKNGILWSTEHGRSGIVSGLDELNRIEKGKNYGWPVIQGDETREGMITPILHSGANDTWAPAGIAYRNNTLFFGGLRGQGVYKTVLENGVPRKVEELFKGELGRVRDVVVGPDGSLYITTSNQDGRGTPQPEDDKVLKLNIP
ncbi:MAG: PQQ-dependent sugar dehydrogenase [Patescibacteria group bacterium]